MEINKGEDELYQIMKIKMNTEEEQIFMISHYLYLEYGNDNTKFVIDFNNVWKNIEFSLKGNAKRVLEKNFIENIDYKKAAYHLGEAAFISENENKNNIDYKKAAPHLGGEAFINEKNLGGAGKNKELILLTVDCFKNFCMLSGTKKSKEIRSYYIKMENIMHEYYKNFKIKNNELQNSLELSKKETLIKRHEVLIESNKNKWLVYFCKIKLYDDGSFILKIGETIDIKNRIDALRCNFGMDIILLDVFICENSIKFEKSLHNSNELLKFKYNELEHKNKKFSTEAYHIPNQKEYEKIVKFAYDEINKYNNIEITKLRIEEKKINLEQTKFNIISSLIPTCKNQDEIMNLLNTISEQVKINNLKNTDDNQYEKDKADDYNNVDDNYDDDNNQCEKDNEDNEDNEDNQDEKDNQDENNEDEIINNKKPNSTSPIVQIYHKNDLKKVVNVYDSIMEATRDFNYNDKTASFTAIKKAYQHKTIYLDYRWHFILDRKETDLFKPREIGNTVITKDQNKGKIAMLNINKTKIIKVFNLCKDAAKEILQHPSAMCVAVKFSTPLNNYYWMRWENIEDSIKNDFLESNILPEKYKNIRGIKIQQLDPITNETIKIFLSYTDVQKELKISIRKVKELIENNETYKGKYKFKFL